MDPRPLHRIAPIGPQPAPPPPSTTAPASGQFARDLIDALRHAGGSVATKPTEAGGHDTPLVDEPLDQDLASADPFGFGDDGSISTDTISVRTDELLQRLTARLDQRFAERGIDIGAPIELRRDTHGRVRVVGDHPDAQQIEAIFADSPELQQTLARLSSAQTLLHASQQHEAFMAAYSNDPHGAVARFAHLFSATSPPADFRLQHADGEWTTRFA